MLQGALTLEETVQLAWDYLDQKFQTRKKLSQQILSTVQCGPLISSSDPNELTEFAQHCESALCIMRIKPGTLATLNEQTTQDMIVNRLCSDLNQKWYDYRYERLNAKGAVSFESFAKWIKIQADIQLGPASAAPDAPKKQSAQQLTRTSSFTFQFQTPNLPSSSTPRPCSPDTTFVRNVSPDDPAFCVLHFNAHYCPTHRIQKCSQITHPKPGGPTPIRYGMPYGRTAYV